MKRLITLLAVHLILCAAVSAQVIDVTQLDKIGDAMSFVRDERGITITCRDNSQVQLMVLAPDLIRVRASFAKPIPGRDHSWAIEKDDWRTPPWNVSETADAITITTSEVEAIVRKSPLLIDFRDAHTHNAINADDQPMAYDAKSALASIEFDPTAGHFIA